MSKVHNYSIIIHMNTIIIGAGAAGIMAAISTKVNHPEYDVIILDRTYTLGRKILVCGAGRCNITNINLKDTENKNLEQIIKERYYGADNKFVLDIFSRFNYKDIIDFFENLGVSTYVEKKTNIGKVFPTTDSAKTITRVLENMLNRLGVKIIYNTEVFDIDKDMRDKFKLYTRTVDLSDRLKLEFGYIDHKANIQKEYVADKLIITTGGKTYPALGSDGSIYKILETFGHKITDPVPSALPLVTQDYKLIKELSGQKSEFIVTSYIDGVEVKTRFEDVMFTEYGLSGPAILNISREISIAIHRQGNQNIQVGINFLTKYDGTFFTFEEFQKRVNKFPFNNFNMVLTGILPNKIADTLSKFIAKTLEIGEIDNKMIIELGLSRKIYDMLIDWRFDIKDTRTWNEAEFTAGGVDTKDINSNNLESKLTPNLYFAGEVLDVDGDVGGFNLSWAWSSGWVVGKMLDL